MARRMVIAGNWKMNMTPNSAVALIKELIPLVQNDDVDVALCVPDLDILPCIEAVQGTNIGIGSQNMYFEEKGAFTGEIAPDMLTDVGVEYVILGHSERRSFFAETDETVNKKVLKAFEHDIIPIICCGETLKQRKQGITLDLIRMQIKIAFYNVKPENAKKAIVAYEPIWAIGTGVGATRHRKYAKQSEIVWQRFMMKVLHRKSEFSMEAVFLLQMQLTFSNSLISTEVW